MSSTDSLRLAWCSHDAAKFACEHWHYSHALPTTHDMRVGVWEEGRFIGLVLFSRGANLHIGTPYGLKQTEVCELTRVALTTHRASVSRIVAIALRLLKREAPGLRLIVSYADPARQHHGGIYQAGNWIYVGLTDPGLTVIAGGKRWHRRSVLGVPGKGRPLNGRVLQVPGKHKYLMPLDQAMRDQVRPLAQPFPKRGVPDGQRRDGDRVGTEGPDATCPAASDRAGNDGPVATRAATSRHPGPHS